MLELEEHSDGCYKRENIRCKESGQDVSYDTTNTVFGKDIKRIVNANDKLQFRSVVTSRSSDDSVDNSSPGRNLISNKVY